MKQIVNFHGSDIELISAHYGINQKDIINYSGNVNPLGIPESVIQALVNHLSILGDYPERDYQQLLNALSLYTSLPKESLLLGNGSTELISQFIQWVHPKNATVIGPTYSEYKAELSKINAITDTYRLESLTDFRFNISHFLDNISVDTDLIILCNPNNPTASFVPITDLVKLLDYCQSNLIYLMIDETYIEFYDTNVDVSALSLVSQYNMLFVIRGVSKFYGLPGIRLGYAATSNSAVLGDFSEDKRPWTINSIADYCGRFLFSDQTFINMSHAFIEKEK